MTKAKQWGKKELRQQHIVKLRAALQKSGEAENENVDEIEQKIFDKSNSVTDYLENVAKVLVHCNSKYQRQMGGQLQHNPGMMPGMHGTTQGMPMMHSAPGMTMQTGQGGPMQQAPGVPMQQAPGMHMQQGPAGQMGPGPGGNLQHGAPMQMQTVGPMHVTPGQANMHQNMHPGQMNPNMGQIGPGVDSNIITGMGPGGPVQLMQRRPLYGSPGVNPASPHLQVGPIADDDTIYNVKMAELQKKYIIRLKKLKEKKKSVGGDLKRIDEILDILTTSKKIKLETLMNIENILFKLFNTKGTPGSTDANSVDRGPPSADKSSAGGSTDKISSAVRNIHFCQPLIDGVAHNVLCNNSFFHTVRRTFGTGLYTQHGNVTQFPPAKRPKKGEPTTLDILHSEIERLPTLFKASTKNRNKGDLEVEVRHTKHTIVPCLTVIVPKKYPDQSPWVKSSHNKLGKEIEKELDNNIISMSMSCTLTQILMSWEFCVKKVLKSRMSGRKVGLG